MNREPDFTGRRTGHTGRVTAFLVALGLLAAAPDAASAPALRLADRQSVVVRGVGFKPRERVQLHAAAAASARSSRSYPTTGT